MTTYQRKNRHGSPMIEGEGSLDEAGKALSKGDHRAQLVAFNPNKGEEDAGSSGRSGTQTTTFKAFISLGDESHRPKLPPNEIKAYLQDHQYKHQDLVKKQQQERADRTQRKQVSPANQVAYGMIDRRERGSGALNGVSPHPFLSESPQWHTSVDKQTNSAADQYDPTLTNTEEQSEVQADYQLQHRLQFTPRPSSPRPTPQGV